jgi:hypothetical protein
MVWIILGSTFLVCGVISIGLYIFPILSSLLIALIPFKAFGKWSAALIMIVVGIFQVILIWQNYDLSISRMLIAAIVLTILSFYVTISFIIGLSVDARDLRDSYRGS